MWAVAPSSREPLWGQTPSWAPWTPTAQGLDAIHISQMQWRWRDHHQGGLLEEPCAKSWASQRRRQGHGPCSPGPQSCPPRMAHVRLRLFSNNGERVTLWENNSSGKAPGVPATAPPATRYPPLPCLSSLLLLIKEFLVLEWEKKKTQMHKYGSNLVNVYFRSNTGVSPWIFAYTYFGNKARWKEGRVRKTNHKRNAGGCVAFNKVLCNAPRHPSVTNNHINRKIRHSKTHGARETQLLSLNKPLFKTNSFISFCFCIQRPFYDRYT